MHAWEQIQLTIEYIEEHMSEQITIEMLSKIASLSPFYYQRLFSRLVKRPVIEYIKLRRIAMAVDALLEKNTRIIDVAMSLGFASHAHFTHTFKEAFNLTPDEYRKSPILLNRMTKPQLLLGYTVVDEGVPLITNDIVLEITRRTITTQEYYLGFVEKTHKTLVAELGVASGPDPLADVWKRMKSQKSTFPNLSKSNMEIDIIYPYDENDCFDCFVGAQVDFLPENGTSLNSFELRQGEYIICAIESENIETLLSDTIYKAERYLYDTWLPNHTFKFEHILIERFDNQTTETASMEIWIKIKDDNAD